MPNEPEKSERTGSRSRSDAPGTRGSSGSGDTAGSRSGRAKSSRSGEGKPPVLTERQRAEARKRRQERRRRQQRPQKGNALSRGVRATGHEAACTARFLARGVAAAFEATGPVGRKLGALLGRTGGALLALLAFLGAALGAASRGFGRALAALDRALTPRRALLAAAGLATLLLAISQFTDFRATEIGQPGYSGVEDVTNAPRVDVKSPLGAHSVLLLIVAAGSLAGLVAFPRTGRRRFALVPAVGGAFTVAVTLAIDLPAGLDTGTAPLSYSGVSAILLSGFWLELAAGTVLSVAGLLLWLDPATGDRASLNTDGRASRRNRADRPASGRRAGRAEETRSRGSRSGGTLSAESGSGGSLSSRSHSRGSLSSSGGTAA